MAAQALEPDAAAVRHAGASARAGGHDAGQALVSELIAFDAASAEDALAPLSEPERRALYGLLKRLY